MGPTHPLSSWCEKSTLDAARRDAPFEVLIPVAEAASANTLSAVWACPPADYVLEFDTGVTVWFQLNGIEVPDRLWRRLARRYREFAVGDVNGVVASLADPAVDGAVGGVDWVVGGVRYTVGGNGEISLEALLDVARSMPIRSPGTSGSSSHGLG